MSRLTVVKVGDTLAFVVPAQHISWSYQTVVALRQLEVEVHPRGACRDHILTQQDVRASCSINRPPNLDSLCSRAAGVDVVRSDPPDICEGQRCIYKLNVARSIWGLAVDDIVAEAAVPFR